MTDLVRVADADDIPPGERKIVDVDGISIGIFNIDGTLYALENNCVHQGGPVCTGKQQGKIEATFVAPGERVEEQFSEEVPAIACPWHGYEYDIRTGKHVGDDTQELNTFDVQVEDGDIFVRI